MTHIKNRHTLLTPEGAEEIAAAALKQFRVPLSDRDYAATYYANQPSTDPP